MGFRVQGFEQTAKLSYKTYRRVEEIAHITSCFAKDILQSPFTNSSEYKEVNCTENETVDRHLVRADVNDRDGLGISLAAFPEPQVINPMAKKTQLVVSFLYCDTLAMVTAKQPQCNNVYYVILDLVKAFN